MKPTFATICMLVSLAVSSLAHAEQITTGDLVSFCNKGHPVCNTYLLGALDGILQAAKNDRTRLVCPKSEQTGADLKDLFLTTVALAGNGHDRDPAINVAFVAFKVAMPCK